MKKIKRCKIWLYFGFEPTEADIEETLDGLVEKYGEALQGVTSAEVTLHTNDDGQEVLHITPHVMKFDRIRRITGYLVGTVKRFNNAKQAEERDRVKHESV